MTEWRDAYGLLHLAVAMVARDGWHGNQIAVQRLRQHSHLAFKCPGVISIETTLPQSTIAAGREGVWFLSWDSPRAIRRIDPRTNRVTDTIPVNTDFLSGIAVGAGAVWTTSPQDGQLWRIEPGPHPRARTIPST